MLIKCLRFVYCNCVTNVIQYYRKIKKPKGRKERFKITMNTYKVDYVIQTASRYGKYNYDCTDTVMADTLQEAKEKTKELALTKTSFKRIRVIFKSISNISEF